jgi:hypothetical protein
VAIELISDRRPDEVGAIGVEALLHQQIDMTEVNEAEIERDLLAFGGLRPKLPNIACHYRHPYTIHMDGIWSDPSGSTRRALGKMSEALATGN